MRKKTDERLEPTQIMHETLQMMLQLMKVLGFAPPNVHQDQGAEIDETGSANIRDERIANIYKGYYDMVEHKNRLEGILDSLERQNAEWLEQSDRQKTAHTRKPPRRKGNKWTRPKRGY